MEQPNTPPTPPVSRFTADKARKIFAPEVGPRVIGGVYSCAYWQTTYRVAGIHYGPDALAAIGWDAGWAITVQDAQGVRTHCTAWAEEDKAFVSPPWAVVYRAAHGALPLDHYSNLQAARAHIADLIEREEPGAVAVWLADDVEDPLSTLEAHLFGRHGEPEPTEYVITPLTVADRYDPAVDE